ncbi:hypothetical protein FJZ40_01020 [Candidatus Shapirobacteria bacterium]|nr:hypothetical protein [Candidatus Shapirobacteria bacterium]
MEENEFFLATAIDEEAVEAAVWSIEEGKARALALGETTEWDGKTADDLVRSLELSLSSAIGKIEKAGEKPPEKIILGLADSFVEQGKIIPERLALLKELSLRMSLKPLGFVTASEALAHFYTTTEGAPLNGILVGLGLTKISLVLVSLGKVVSQGNVGRSDNLALDVEEGLLRFQGPEGLPARIILYAPSERINQADLESQKQVLLSYPWQDPERRLPFLHFPKVEIGPVNLLMTAVCLAGGAELAKTTEIVVPEEKPVAEEARPTLGFIRGKDILQAEVGSEEETLPLPAEEVAEEPAPKAKTVPLKETSRRLKALLGMVFGIPRAIFAILTKSGLAVRFPKPRLPGPSLGFGILILLILGLVFGLGFFFLPQATVEIFVLPEDLQKELAVKLDPNVSHVDEKVKVLPAKEVEAIVSGEKTISTTGKKLVGDKAKGEIVIYNRTEARKLFPKGTVLVGPGAVKFSLDDEVSVASRQADLASGVDRWGEAKGGATALDIGPTANLAAGSQFSLESYTSSLYLAKNPAAFSGGTSRQIQVVSEKDREGLRDGLEEELRQKAQEEVKKKMTAGEKLVEESVSLKVTQEEFNRRAGEEAQDLGLKLTVSALGLVFQERDLRDLGEKVFLSLGKNLVFSWDEAKIDFKIDKVNADRSVSLTARLSGQLLPNLDAKEITRNLTGKSFEFAKNYLGSLPKVSHFKTKVAPAFFAPLGRLPTREENIKVTISSK